MQIPNSIIVLRLADGRGYGPIIAPAYQAKVLRAVYRNRLDDTEGKGVIVESYPDDGVSDTRYTEAYSVDAEFDRLRKLYKADGRGNYVDQVFTHKELSDEIAKLLNDEADRLINASKPKKEVVAHKSFVDFGLTADQAVALQSAGFSDRQSCIDHSILDLNNVPGITLDIAKRLSVKDAAKEAAKA